MNLNIKLSILKCIAIAIILLPLNLSASSDKNAEADLKKIRTDIQSEERKRPDIIERDLNFYLDEKATFFPLVDAEDGYNNPCLIPDIEGLKNPILEEILRVLNVRESFEHVTKSGNFGLVRLSETLAVKAFLTESPEYEIDWLKDLIKTHHENKIAGFDICLPIAFFNVIAFDPIHGRRQAPLAVFPRVNSNISTFNLFMKAVVGFDFEARCCIFQLSQAIGRMQSASLVETTTEKGLVADTHLDLSPNNFIPYVDPLDKAICRFTLIDVADFIRGTNKRACPVSVDITYNFLVSLMHLMSTLEDEGYKISEKFEQSIAIKTAWLLYLGYFSAFPKDQLDKLEPIYATMKAYDLFARHTIYGAKLFAGNAPEVAVNRRRYESAFDLIKLLYHATKAGFVMPVKFSGIRYDYARCSAECLFASDELAKSTRPFIKLWEVEPRLAVSEGVRLASELLPSFQQDLLPLGTIEYLKTDLEQLDLFLKDVVNACLLFPGRYDSGMQSRLKADPKGVLLRSAIGQHLTLIEKAARKLSQYEQDNILLLKRLLTFSLSYKQGA